MKILFQGDSITDGGRLQTDWDFNHILGHGYVFNIAGELGALYPEKDCQFINKGISGNRVVDLYARWREDAINLKPDLLSILIGVNDLFKYNENDNGTSTQVYKRTYAFLIEDLKSELPDTKIILCEPFRLNTSKNVLAENIREDLKEKQSVVYDISKKYNTVFVPLQKMFEEACMKKQADYWLWDGVHPSPAGHYLISKQWINAFNKFIR